MTGRPSLDLERLLKLRLVVARFGEMDVAQWWNTNSQLGELGAAALRRGFPRSHFFAQARSVFAVAEHRCAEVFDPPGAVTLWRLPETTEEEFGARWEQWLDSAADLAPFFLSLQSLSKESDLAEIMRSLAVVDDQLIGEAAGLRRSAQDRAVQLPGSFSGTDHEVALLALGFGRGERGALAVPHKEYAA